MGDRAFKEQLYGQFARLGKALASASRLELLDLLAQGERSVDDLAHEAGLSIANASAHLHVLSGAQLTTSRKEGLRVYYRLADPAVVRLWQALRDAGERQLADIDRLVQTFLTERPQLEAITREQLQTRMAGSRTVVLDVRPALEYRQGHIAGARSIPVDELEQHIAELDPATDVVAYCRGPYCVYADEAVTLLKARGFRAVRYDEGYPDWAAAGLPVGTEQTMATDTAA
ncbi:MAG TPA: metalloregulator ArsR/SmtB family transcription factor [Chloroflexota bacterium]|nr:metalloregulator ArsR/SmtB family transcription factor [Chloroflexota bacterium]